MGSSGGRQYFRRAETDELSKKEAEMKAHEKKSPCEGCTKPYCHEEVVCPECSGQGLSGALQTHEESDDYGLMSLVADLVCPGCEGRGTMTAYCAHYADRLVPA